MTWAIYYADGTVRRDTDGPWDLAPLDGVVFVVEKIGESLQVHGGADYYARLDDTEVVATGELGPLLRARAPWIKHGVWTTHAIMERTRARIRGEWA